ncbi:hypothetical protein SAV31267_068450 [Streptomyces avermitilis]|uniref:Uncharacterized protein n=1 Tax=Streptomyces avermitilis TaxID=33903 RepID=A0A4D4MYU3_STRAX|nr:hypothetical protein SAV31267_068450 [Streptomyces avermitilis]
MDLDQNAAVGQRVTGDLDLGLRGGERRRVLEQLGEQVHEVVDDPARDLGGRDRGQLDALVLLHLGGGGAEHVDQRDRAGPAAAGLFTGEHEEVLTVTAHAGREVVELEQGGQLVRVGLAGLQFGDERELTLDEALGAAREVGEHRVDVASQQGLLGGESYGLAVHVVEGRGHLADLVLGVHTDRLHGRVDVLRVGLGQLPDQLGQAVLGDLGRGVLEPAQRADHGAGHDEGADERDAEDDEDQRTRDDRFLLGLVAQLAGLLLHLVEQGELDLRHLLELGRVVVDPVLVRALVLLADAVLVAQRALRVLVGGLDGRVAAVDGLRQIFVAVAVDAVEARYLGFLAVQGRERVLAVVLGELAEGVVARGQRRRDDRALHGRVLLGGREGRQGARALDHLRVAGRLGHVLREAEQLGDEAVVALDRLRGVLGVLVGDVADAAQVAQLTGQTHDAVADAGELAVAAGVVDLLGAREEGGARAVRLLADALDREVGGRGAVRQRTCRLVALVLERGGELGRLLGHVGQQLHVVELLDLVHGVADAQRAERGRGDHGEREQRDQTRGDAPVAQSYARAAAGAAARRLRGWSGGLGRTGAPTALAGLTRSRVLGVLGRGTAVGPAVRLRLRRSAAIPLETSLH